MTLNTQPTTLNYFAAAGVCREAARHHYRSHLGYRAEIRDEIWAGICREVA